MSRRRELEAVADRVRTCEGVERAWVANSFQDRLLVVEVPAGASLPPAVADELDAHDLEGANAAYGIESGDGPSSAGTLGDVERHRFLDVRGE